MRALRRLLYCGEWIASHTLHIYFLHAPDFLGVADSIELARRDRAAVERGLALKKAGNAILETIGGRPIHPVDVRGHCQLGELLLCRDGPVVDYVVAGPLLHTKEL